MEGFALGELRLSAKRFWRMSWREYTALAAGFHRAEIRRWQHTRWLGTLLLNVNRADGPALTPEEVLPLPGDRLPVLMDADAFEATMSRLAAFDYLFSPPALA